jgi:hypothetical protein
LLERERTRHREAGGGRRGEKKGNKKIKERRNTEK